MRHEARAPLRRYGTLAAFYLVLAALCGFGARHAYTMQHGGDVRVAEGEVVGFESLDRGSRRLALIAFVDHSGEPRTARGDAQWLDDAKPGARTPVIYSPGDSRFARPVNEGERMLRAMLQGCVVVIVALALLALAFGAWAAHRRTRLVHAGLRVTGESVALEWRAITIGAIPPSWRLRASWFDRALPGWREACSDWQPANRVPELLPERVLILVDPARADRAWIPVCVALEDHTRTQPVPDSTRA